MVVPVVMQVKKLPRSSSAAVIYSSISFRDKENRELLPSPSGRAVDWLPAIEVVGEGVFLHLNAEHLRQWEQKPNVIKQAARINEQAMRIDSKRLVAEGNVTEFYLTSHSGSFNN